MRNTPVLWRNLLLFWLTYSLFYAELLLNWSAALPQPFSIGRALRESLGTWLPWVPLTAMLIEVVRRFPLERGRLATSLPMLALGSFAALLGKALCVFAFNGYFAWYDELPSFAAVLAASVRNNLLLCCLIIGAAHALLYASRYRQRESEVARLRASLSEARLQALSAQLNPHFLFNTLNTIAELVHHDAEAADRMLVGLSTLLRRGLDSSAEPEVPLRLEMELLREYLDIQCVRFGARLRVSFAIQPECEDARVPYFLLQPLVENAIVHAIALHPDGGSIHVAARRDAGSLQITVQDSGAPADARPVRSGIGLRNTTDRLACFYGDASALRLERLAAGGTCVTLELPFRGGGEVAA
ncbi:MAG: hypothetical protein BGP24_17350 [Lysobacterales bacterium 69-70]|nr:histidine kinase [Xanthomonadaceae bacterium]ODU30742.1 MAG: hypothetical protein ABS97_20690 [Xanthomonadaceae bacterium SCN 69-320]ODV17672.1 MAG: hypothetical protein ABT27_16530 [Xanthomonadaceae bacterium SCN 69-25]OJZ00281.1 MAG: hypothetical protein BGP24_17350 [Xanthomonadales bacterium 69-70]